MKKRHYLIPILLLCLISCDKESYELELNENSNSIKASSVFQDYSSNQMVIKYKPSISDIEKQNIRNNYNVVGVKKCDCADPTLELWMFSDRSTDRFSIEEKVITAREDPDLEGIEFNSFIRQENPNVRAFLNTSNINIALQKVVSRNNNVTIAVLDSGVDYNYYGFENPFLYNNYQNENNCSNNEMQDYFGWDFVNQDNDPFDDYGHGTIVTKLMTQVLEEQHTAFQILPIKSFDENGRGNLFDVLCGFKYALNNPDVNIINMSFGWYNLDNELFNKYILESESRVLLSTSAGNRGVSTDIYSHLPSSSSSNNIISVASLGEDITEIKLANFSNFGSITVDIAAQGENIEFYVAPNEFILVSGTSYSTAFTSGISGMNYSQGMTVEALKNNVLSNAVFDENLGKLKHSSYINY